MTTTKTIPITSTSNKKRRAPAPRTNPENEQQRIERLLENYKEISKRQYGKIEPMDSVRYAVNDELRYGGVVVKRDPGNTFLVLKNFAKHFTWSVDLTQPKLRVFWKKRYSNVR
jgi:hypothetical protein